MNVFTKIIIAILLIASPAAASPQAPALEKGKVIYLDFWASWCAPCKESFPWLNKVSKESKDLIVIGVNLDENKADAEKFLKRHPALFDIVFDPTGKWAEKYEVKGMPFSVLIDKKGKVRHSHIGFSAKDTGKYEAQIVRLLEEK